VVALVYLRYNVHSANVRSDAANAASRGFSMTSQASRISYHSFSGLVSRRFRQIFQVFQLTAVNCN